MDACRPFADENGLSPIGEGPGNNPYLVISLIFIFPYI